MDAIEHHPPVIDVDAEVARILQRLEKRQKQQDSWVEPSYWRLALTGSLLGAGLVAAGIIIGLALIRALH